MPRGRVIALLVGLALVIGLVGLRAIDPYPVAVLREIAFDTYQRLRPRAPTAVPLRVIDIDEASLGELGQWPWPRDRLALLTDRLTELGAAAIAFDVLFPEPDRLSPRRLGRAAGIDATNLADTDEQFARAIGQAPVIIGFADSSVTDRLPAGPKSGFAISGTDPTDNVAELRGAVLPLPLFVEAATGLGGLSLSVRDLATTVRRIPLLWSDGQQFYPSLAIEALRVALGIATIVVLGELDAPFVEAVRVGNLTVPTLPTGDLWLYYRPPDPALYVSAKAVLADDYQTLADRISGHIVLVGTSASGLLDIQGTTLGDNVPGVSIHAQALEQILSNTYLTRADWVAGLEIVGFAILGLAMVPIVPMLGPIAGLMLGAAGLLAVGGFSWLMFSEQGVMVDPSFPIVGLATVYAAMVFFQFMIADTDKRALRRAFGYYVSPSLLTQIERNAYRLRLGGEMRDLTVLFCDVRGFTPLSEHLPPTRIVALLNVLFSALGRRIIRELGTIDKFIGDAVMAFWNAPVDVPDHARRACLAALGMREDLRQLNATDAFLIREIDIDRNAIAVGIGIATGPALVGNMGLETRFDYSCIGDTVNTASRVEGACKAIGYDLVTTERTRLDAADLAFLTAGALPLKGKTEPVIIHLLVGDAELCRSPAFTALQAAHEAMITALQRGGDDMPSTVARCATLAHDVEPGLAHFYELVLDRRADFAPLRGA